MKPSIEFRHIDKSFIGVHALRDVSFACYPGTVHVLQGENGAGKSTLLKILTGMYRPDSGEILIHSEKVTFRSTADAKQYRIAMVYQEMSLLPELTVAQNIYLNQKHDGLLIRETQLIRQALQLAGKYGIEIEPYAAVGDLPIASQQMIEILKALSTDPDILILDEPTSTLTSTEVDKLYRIVLELKKAGKTVIFISHRLEEVFRFGDCATILKDGSLIDTVDLREVSESRIVQLMVGRELKSIFPPKAEQAGEEILSVHGLSDRSYFHDITFRICRGEIVGIGALDGQGQSQLFESLAGLRHHTAGTIRLNGVELNFRDVKKANLSMVSLRRRQTLGFIHRRAERRQAQDMVARLNIKTSSLQQAVMNLSGGNQQKVSIGKSLEDLPKVLILNEPTRGIDVEAKQEIYRLLRSLAHSGVAVLCYTSDMMETIGLCDRVLTLYEGHLTGELSGERITEKNIMHGAMNRNLNQTEDPET